MEHRPDEVARIADPDLPALTLPPGSLLPMQNPIRQYAWGSSTTLARMQGRPPTREPEAELWMGAHPSAPSLVPDPDGHARSLLERVDADPVGFLGAETVARFGARLPYLMKVLAVRRPLSIQVHPSAEQAARGFARENAVGIPLDARHRSYVDADAKPEFLYALTPFEGLFGLRKRDRACRLLGLVGTPRLAPIVAGLASGQQGAVVDAIAALVAWPRAGRLSLVGEVVLNAFEALDALSSGRLGHDADAMAALRWVVRLAQEHPADPLVVAPLLLRLRSLQPGATVFTPAGVPHAHLVGTAVEVMSCSDNVVRAGLTGKHVDADELIAILDADADAVVGVPEVRLSAHETGWRPPVADFQLSRVQVPQPGGQPVVLSPHIRGPQVLLCVDGDVSVRSGGSAQRLQGGRSLFVPAPLADRTIQLTGSGTVFRVATGG